MSTPARNSDAAAYLEANLSPDAQLIITYIQEEFIKMKTELREEMAAMFGPKLKEVDELKTQVMELNSKVSKLETLIDEADQYERRDCLLLSGPALPIATTGENCKNLVQNLIRSECDVNIDVSDISTAHRIGKRPLSQQPDKRSIIVKFCRRDTKDDVYRSSKRRARPQQLYVNESLSPTRKTIYYTLRQIRRAHPELLAGCSTFDGKIYAYTKASTSDGQQQRDRRHLIITLETLKKFCAEHIKKPIETFLNNYQPRDQ